MITPVRAEKKAARGAAVSLAAIISAVGIFGGIAALDERKVVTPAVSRALQLESQLEDPVIPKNTNNLSQLAAVKSEYDLLVNQSEVKEGLGNLQQRRKYNAFGILLACALTVYGGRKLGENFDGFLDFCSRKARPYRPILDVLDTF